MRRDYLLAISNERFRCSTNPHNLQHEVLCLNHSSPFPLKMSPDCVEGEEWQTGQVSSSPTPFGSWNIICVPWTLIAKSALKKIKMISYLNSRRLSEELLFLKQNQYLTPLMLLSKDRGENRCCCKDWFCFLFMYFHIDQGIHSWKCKDYHLNFLK